MRTRERCPSGIERINRTISPVRFEPLHAADQSAIIRSDAAAHSANAAERSHGNDAPRRRGGQKIERIRIVNLEEFGAKLSRISPPASASFVCIEWKSSGLIGVRGRLVCVFERCPELTVGCVCECARTLFSCARRGELYKSPDERFMIEYISELEFM